MTYNETLLEAAELKLKIFNLLIEQDNINSDMIYLAEARSFSSIVSTVFDAILTKLRALKAKIKEVFNKIFKKDTNKTKKSDDSKPPFSESQISQINEKYKSLFNIENGVDKDGKFKVYNIYNDWKRLKELMPYTIFDMRDGDINTIKDFKLEQNWKYIRDETFKDLDKFKKDIFDILSNTERDVSRFKKDLDGIKLEAEKNWYADGNAKNTIDLDKPMKLEDCDKWIKAFGAKSMEIINMGNKYFSILKYIFEILNKNWSDYKKPNVDKDDYKTNRGDGIRVKNFRKGSDDFNIAMSGDKYTIVY